MNIKKLNRKEKETLYIDKMTELQTIWKNPVDDDWDDKLLAGSIKSTIGQIRFEKVIKFFKNLILLFVILGIVGLILFGLRQIFLI